jgi:hypothetical protein
VKYRMQVHTYSCAPDTWTGNAIVHDTAEAAIEAAKDLFGRWTAVKFWRVVDEHDTVIATNEEESQA